MRVAEAQGEGFVGFILAVVQRHHLYLLAGLAWREYQLSGGDGDVVALLRPGQTIQSLVIDRGGAGAGLR